MDLEKEQMGRMGSLAHATTTTTSSTGPRSRIWRVVLLAVATLGLIAIFCNQLVARPSISGTSSTSTLTSHPHGDAAGDTLFTWPSIKPSSEETQWHACYNTYNCARVSLPLNWLNTSDSRRVIIPLIRLPAQHKASYLGPVFFNPGGPGGSGIYAMLNRGQYIQNIIGTNHDLISFDPRGVGLSEPSMDCWGSEWASKMWEFGGREVADASNTTVYNAYARAVSHSKRCATASGMLMGEEANVTGEHHPLLSYISTASVASDLNEILRLMGQEKLKYWGFSYGTYIGGVFASMWPEKVERMVNDGNVNYVEWGSNTHKTFSRDADQVMKRFYEYCAEAGEDKKRSALYIDGQDAIQVEERVDGILETLKKRPIVTDTEVIVEGVPEIVTYSMVRKVIATSLYQPLKMFPMLAQILAGLEQGDAGPLVDFYAAFTKPLGCSCGANNHLHRDHNNLGDAVSFSKPGSLFDLQSQHDGVKEGTLDASTAVICADGGVRNDTLEAAEENVAALLKMSKAAGAVNAVNWLDCSGWKIKAKDRFTGPFEGNTSHPILFVANEFDNVTPGANAKENARGFVGARVVRLVGGIGHTSLSSPSKELNSYIYNYFQTGELPKGEALPDEKWP